MRKHGAIVGEYETDAKPSEAKTKKALEAFQVAMIELLNIGKLSEAD